MHKQPIAQSYQYAQKTTASISTIRGNETDIGYDMDDDDLKSHVISWNTTKYTQKGCIESPFIFSESICLQFIYCALGQKNETWGERLADTKI